MEKNYLKSCADCLHWQPYPTMDQMGICDNPASLNYSRALGATNESCEFFILNALVAKKLSASRPIEVKGKTEFDSKTEIPVTQRRCEDCHQWWPLDILPFIGECHNPVSLNFKKVVFQDHLSGVCFQERSFEKADLAWCRTCRQTVDLNGQDAHSNHKLFVNTSRFPVEDMMEVTLAGE